MRKANSFFYGKVENELNIKFDLLGGTLRWAWVKARQYEVNDVCKSRTSCGMVWDQSTKPR